ncbi:MAG: DUF885 domain-containing protein [Sphingomonadaceae bacterium]
MRLRVLALFLGAAAMPILAAPAPAFAAEAPAAALKALFADSDEGSLKRNPLNAIFRGDLRYADRLGDYITDAYIAGEKAALEDELKRLAAIDRTALTPTDRVAYDVFKWQQETALAGLNPDLVALTVVRPVDHFAGFHTFYPDFASGQGAAPFKTLADYDNNLKRHAEFIVYLDRAVGRFREGLASGVVQPKLVVQNVIDQLDLQLKQPVTASPYYTPVLKFPEAVAAPEQERLKAAYARATGEGIHPAYKRLRDFLATEYLPQARDSVGLVGMKGGDRLYAYLIRQNTTVDMDAAAVHTLGLAEVARITKEMDTIRKRVRFKGDLQAFFKYLSTAKRFQPPSALWLKTGYEAIGKRVDIRVREQFSTIPKTPLEIRPVPAFREKTDAAGSYQQGTPDGSRPGVFYYNTYDLPTRSTWGMETLYLHEAVPGHHFQISLAQENAALPSFMRFGGNTAYVEGWALYAETLWRELGVTTDHYQRFGGLNDEMLRAMRLVVDTGIHAKGWSRDQAIRYMMTNSSMGLTDATAEVERYIAIPGQALAYKIGALTIQRLKAKAQASLGARFDPRKFHAQVLMTGALPMAVLEKKIDDWIASGGA